MNFAKRKLIIYGLLLAIAVLVFIYYEKFSDYFTLHKLQENRRFLTEFVQKNYLLSVIIYVSIYSLLIACGMPLIMPIAMIGGFLYGIVWGLLYAEISCLIGSIISFLILRYVVAHWIRSWHSERIMKFNEQVKKYGNSYLLMLHFLSVIPLFVINLLAAVANVPLITVIWVTIVGALPFNLLCVVAGRQLSSIQSYKDIFSPTIIILLAILALVALSPILIRKIKGSLGV
jgi:uncharacterized membrane protein YdjX (TVP38/TMEM64 family)